MGLLSKALDFHPLQGITRYPVISPVLQGDQTALGDVVPGSYVDKKDQNLGVVDLQQTSTFFAKGIAGGLTAGYLSGAEGVAIDSTASDASAGSGFATSSAPDGYFTSDSLTGTAANDTLSTSSVPGPDTSSFPEPVGEGDVPATGSGAPSAETTQAEQSFIQGAQAAGGGGILDVLKITNSVAGTIATVSRLLGGGGVSTQAQAPQLGRTYFLPAAEQASPSLFSRAPGGAGGAAPAMASSSSSLLEIAGGVLLAVALVYVLTKLKG